MSQWKKQLQESSVEIFGGKKPQSGVSEALVSQLYEEVGRLKFELDWLKKKLPDSVDFKRQMIEHGLKNLSISRQCELLGLIMHSSYYYQPDEESLENLMYMRLIDEQYMKTPFWGSRNMATWLNQQMGCPVNRKRIQRLMCVMGIEAIYPKPRTSEARSEHRKYPYLLRDVATAFFDLVSVRTCHGPVSVKRKAFIHDLAAFPSIERLRWRGKRHHCHDERTQKSKIQTCD